MSRVECSDGGVITPPLPSIHRLEALLGDLGLGGGDGLGRGRVDEAASLLAVLQGRRLAGADAEPLAVVGAAGRRAVGVVDAPARDELGGLAGADVLGTRVVGGDDGQGGDGDCVRVLVFFFFLFSHDRCWERCPVCLSAWAKGVETHKPGEWRLRCEPF